MRVILLSLCACVGAPVQLDRGTVLTPVASNPIAKSDWESEIVAAIDIWQSAIGDCEFPFVIGDGGYPIELVPPNRWPHERNGHQTEDGIQIVGGIPFGRRHVIAHEIGHALGRWHSEDRESVMFYIPGDYVLRPEAEATIEDYCR